LEGRITVSPQDRPWPSLGKLDPESARTLIGLAADVTLLLDPRGRVVALTCGDGERLPDEAPAWVGQDWLVTVSADSRERLAGLLREAGGPSATRWIHVKHPSSRGTDIPVQYRAMGLEKSGHVIAVGRELQAVASLQQQLVDAQQALERDYWRYREMETRYRLLFRMISEGTLMVEAATLRVVEANPAAAELLGIDGKGVVGRSFIDTFEADGARAVRTLLARLVPEAAPEDVMARCQATGRDLAVSAASMRQGQTALHLVRIVPALPAPPAESLEGRATTFDLAVESAPDCILITDPDGLVLAANPAFFHLVQLPLSFQIRGESLDRWLAGSGIDLRILISNLAKYGSIRLFRTSLRGEIGATSEVEISAGLIPGGERHLAFFIRDIGRRLSRGSLAGSGLSGWIEELTERVGRAPLRDLVRESTEQIERLCIEAALELTGDNRASAAELLGLSRQSLYVKLTRYGLGSGQPEENG
jgi:transcriptional regulator PpsR